MACFSRSSFLPVALGLPLVMAVACERPDLDLGHTSGGTSAGTTGDGTGTGGGDGDGDTTGNATSGGDTGGDGSGSSTTSTSGNSTGEPDAGGCPDGDGDGVCDAEDNCPKDDNPGQQDGDGDGTGDACESCGLQVDDGVVSAPPGTLTDADGRAFVGNVSIDGMGNVAVVNRGDDVKVSLDYAVTICLSGSGQHVAIGIEGESPGCLLETSCGGQPADCNVPVVAVLCDPEIPGSVTLTAPDTPGEYYILVDHGLGDCDGWSSGSEPGSSQRIGGICVQ